jgi:hypothetical protein
VNTDTISLMLRGLRPADADCVEDWFSAAQRAELLREITSAAPPDVRGDRHRARDHQRWRPHAWTTRHLLPNSPRATAGSSGRHARGWLAGGVLAAAILAVVLVVLLSGRAPSVADAFPVLNRPSVITPAELRGSLAIYGVSGTGGLDIGHGRPVSTPWGTGYVLTNPHDTIICVVAPGLDSHDWGASCANQTQATATGTYWYLWAYDSATHSARFIALYPQGATVTSTTRDGTRRSVRLHHGLLAADITQPERISITIDHHTTSFELTPTHASPAYGTATGSSTATTATATTSR